MTIFGRGLTVLIALAYVLTPAAPATAMARAQSPSPAPVTLVAPAGWFQNAGGSVVAASQGDLTATVPSGPRARIIGTPSGKKGVRDLVKRIRGTERSAPELVDGPTDLATFSPDLAGIVITFSGTQGGVRLVRRDVIVTAPSRTPTLVVLEAPEAKWAGAVDTLMTILQG